MCILGMLYTYRKSALIFYKEEISLWILAQNLYCLLHHLSQGGVCGWITVQLITTVFHLKETYIERNMQVM